MSEEFHRDGNGSQGGRRAQGRSSHLTRVMLLVWATVLFLAFQNCSPSKFESLSSQSSTSLDGQASPNLGGQSSTDTLKRGGNTDGYGGKPYVRGSCAGAPGVVSERVLWDDVNHVAYQVRANCVDLNPPKLIDPQDVGSFYNVSLKTGVVGVGVFYGEAYDLEAVPSPISKSPGQIVTRLFCVPPTDTVDVEKSTIWLVEREVQLYADWSSLLSGSTFGMTQAHRVQAISKLNLGLVDFESNSIDSPALFTGTDNGSFTIDGSSGSQKYYYLTSAYSISVSVVLPMWTAKISVFNGTTPDKIVVRDSSGTPIKDRSDLTCYD